MVSNSWHSRFIQSAFIFSEESKCSAKKVGCVIVTPEGNMAIGVNGTLPGTPNCNELFKKIDGLWYRYEKVPQQSANGIQYESNIGDWVACDDQEEHHKWSLVNEIHAEMNALAKANRQGITVNGATAYVTHSPCSQCAKNMASHGIAEIIYSHEYDDIKEVQELLKDKVNLRRMVLVDVK